MAQSLPESSSFISNGGSNDDVSAQEVAEISHGNFAENAMDAHPTGSQRPDGGDLPKSVDDNAPFVPLGGDSQLDNQLAAYRYDLPEGYIAQTPVTPRDSSKLLVIDSLTSHDHTHFCELTSWLMPGDLLVLNNTRVIPARLFGRKQNELGLRKKNAENSTVEAGALKGAIAEILLIEPIADDRWLALVKPGRRLQPGTKIIFEVEGVPVMQAVIESRDEPTKGRIIRLIPLCDRSINELIYQLGQVPLPPYITHSESLPEQYQTVYAQRQGAIAAPTAGLHFTQRLLKALADKGVETTEVTLHVGVGTFRPVEVADIKTHKMHQERIDVPEATVAKIRQTKARGGRVIAVGTTSTRALEGAAAITGELQAYQGKTEIFIYPGYQWKVIDGLITNFHLPESSLLMMVSALIGRERLMAIYKDAIAQNYRFYSFGDAMLILPEACG
ncbi:MAG: tRNA preQ1(34) S-adenosylmethionine ribosyltransferase-isomerase QueA [Cyanobacteria bacterium J06649_5]